MAVENDDPRIKVTAGNDILVDFDFAFKIFAATDLTCYKVDAAGVYTPGVLNGGGATGYTVVFDTDEETGTVTWDVAPVTSGFSVVVGDAIPDTQTANFPREGVTPAATQKNAYDKLTIMVQQLVERVSRAILQPSTPVNPDPISVDPPVDAKGLYYKDNGDGTWSLKTTTDDLDSAATDAAASAAAAGVSAGAAAASETAAGVSAGAAAASAASAATSAATALATITVITGTQAARPASYTTLKWYYATDAQALSLYIPAAARWFLIG